jgi:hypothetical protein
VWTLKVLKSGIGPFRPGNEKWIELLHDPMDLSSSLRTNADERTANRLYLLDEWKELEKDENLDSLSIYSLSYILKAANECLAGEAGEYSPEYLSLWVTDDLLQHLESIRSNILRIYSTLKTIELRLHSHVREFFGFGDQEVNTPLEQLFGKVLLAQGSDFLKLRQFVQDCHTRQNGRTPAQSEFSTIAKALYPNDDPETAQKRLNALNTVASLGQTANKRPLWDIRYHQMIRSIQSASIQFNVEELTPEEKKESITDYKLTHPVVDVQSGVINETGENSDNKKSMRFSLGRCLNCGQPYLIGFARTGSIPKGGLQLYPNQSGNHRHMHALSWIADPETDADNTPKKKTKKESNEMYLDPYKGRLYSSNCENRVFKDPLITIHHYTNDSDSRGTSLGFINQCPCCGRTTHANVGLTKAQGLVSLYSDVSSSNKAVAISSILEELPPSSDPESRSYPGQGKKVLAFSDSRYNSAKIAIDLDKNTSERNFASLLYHALRTPHENRQLRKEYGDDDGRTYPEANTLEDLSIAFRDKIVEEQLIGQYLILDYIPNKNSATVSAMRSLDAATTQLIGALRRYRVHPILTKAGGVFELRDNLKKKLISGLEDYASDHKLLCNRNKAEQGIKELIKWLFETSSISDSHNDKIYPETFLFPGFRSWYRAITKERNQEQNTISIMCSRKIHKLLSPALSSEPGDEKREAQNIKKCLEEWLADTVWKQFNSANKEALIDGGLFQPYSSSLQILPVETNFESPKEPLILRSEEHTAQLSSNIGGIYQEAFAKGKINVLSCSTTFEMGVDLGDLSCVFLNNHPPTVANYKQRAGRAGRRAGMGSMVFTFSGKDPHDSYYFDHPDEMFFGTVVPPIIYLDNPIYLARHLRAEAMHRFLCWVSRNKFHHWEVKRWESVGWFFFGISADKNKSRIGNGDSDCWLNYLSDWSEHEDHEEFSQYVRKIIGSVNPSDQAPGYDVIEDLIWQLNGTDPANTELTPELCYQLSGPNMKDSAELPLYDRILKQLVYYYRGEESPETYSLGSNRKTFADLLEKWPENQELCMTEPSQTKNTAIKIRHLLTDSSISYLAHNRILPSYGFPSEVIELKLDKGDKQDVELTRDMKIGIYEYAQGRTVIANKRIYLSKGAGFYNTPRIGEVGGITNSLIAQDQLCPCCRELVTSDTEKHKKHSGGKLLSVLRPDFFQAAPSINGQNFDFSSYEPRIQITPGKTKEPYHIGDTNILVSEYTDRRVIYLNTNNFDGFKYKDTNEFYCLMHTVHTDVLQLKLDVPDPWMSSQDRSRNAWISVSAALKRAIQRVLKVQQQDIGITPNYEDRSWAIHDASSGGAGFVYRLLLSQSTAEKLSPESTLHRADLIYKIVEEALRICEGSLCHCYENTPKDDRIPADLQEVVSDHGSYRHRFSCYHCLRDYTNKYDHDSLDVSDAAIIIRLLLNK